MNTRAGHLRRPSLRTLVVGAAAAVAAISLIAPAHPTFDVWSWLIWGREIGHLDLNTASGSSWKPLPVMITTLLAPTGDAAPEIWLFLIRWSWLIAAALTGSIAMRLTSDRTADAVPGGRTMIGLAAALALTLIDDSFTPWLRQGMTGLSEPLLVAALLAAYDARLRGRGGLSLAAVFAAALIRPEAWPLLAWLLWERWRDRQLDAASTATAAGLLVAIPLLWFVPDLLGSGDALTGAIRAREGSGTPPVEALEVYLRLFLMPVAVLWVGAVAALRSHRDEPSVRDLALAAAAWVAVTALLAALGYAGLPRFLTPVAAAVCILGAVGLGELWVRLRSLPSAGPSRSWVVLPVAGLVTLALIGQTVWRIGDLVGDASGIATRADREDEIVASALALEAETEGSCSDIYVIDYLFSPAVSWHLDRSIRFVHPIRADSPPECSTRLEAEQQ